MFANLIAVEDVSGKFHGSAVRDLHKLVMVGEDVQQQDSICLVERLDGRTGQYKTGSTGALLEVLRPN